MIPGPVCLHYHPRLIRLCDAGLRAPHDCHSCPAYDDGRPFLGVDAIDQERRTRWAELRDQDRSYALPRAVFRGQAA